MAPAALIGFMCTGPSTGFDPICNTSHTEFVVAFTLVVGALVVAVGRRLTLERSRAARIATMVGLTPIGAVLGFALGFGFGRLMLG